MSVAAAILLVEDIEEDAWLIRRAFEKAGVRNPMVLATDGKQAVSYLEGAGRYADRKVYPKPWLVLLDLRPPRRDGFKVLRWMEGNAAPAGLRVVALTNSHKLSDITRECEGRVRSDRERVRG